MSHFSNPFIKKKCILPACVYVCCVLAEPMEALEALEESEAGLQKVESRCVDTGNRI